MRTSFQIVVFATLLIAVSADADVIYVPDDYGTIQGGIDAASAGDIVMVAEGEYFEEITLRAGIIVQNLLRGNIEIFINIL